MSGIVPIEGRVTRCIFKDGSVFSLVDAKGREYKCVRRGFEAVEGMKLAGRARVDHHAKYGEQYTFIDEPKRIIDLEVNENSIISSLKTPVRGFGQVGAKKLYDALCTQGNPLVLLQKACVFPEIEAWLKDVVRVLGLKCTDKDVDDILKHWRKNETKQFLVAIGIESRKIKKMSDDLVKTLLQNPFMFYELSVEQCLSVCKTFQVKFTEADVEAAHLARFVHADAVQTLSTYFQTAQFDGVLVDQLDKHRLIRFEPGRYAFERTYEGERSLAEWFREHRTESPEWDDEWEGWVPKCSTLAPEQIEAVRGSLSNSCSVITGPAGSGKTRIISEIVTLLRQRDKHYVIGAFTGKATYRVRETLRGILKAGEDILTFTLHSLIYKKLAYKRKLESESSSTHVAVDLDEDDFKISGDNAKTIGSIPDYVVETDPEYVIIDESSMVTGQLLQRFLTVFPNVKNLILIGDAAQLEPFSSWGRPFHFLTLDRGHGIPVFELKHNFRSVTAEDGGENGILLNADRIRSATRPIDFVWTPNFIGYSGKGGIDIIMQVLRKFNDNGERATDIKILSPINDKVSELNGLCQEFYTKQTIFNSKTGIIAGRKFCIGDLIIVTKNNYKIGLFNGSEGVVSDIDEVRQEVKVNFEEQMHWFGKVESQKVFHRLRAETTTMSKMEAMLRGKAMDIVEETRIVNEIDDIQLAYALTIHRSQGSEWKFVIVYIPYATRNCNRNMIYTAVTRAKNMCFCIDETGETAKATGRAPEERRELFGQWLGEFPAVTDVVEAVDEALVGASPRPVRSPPAIPKIRGPLTFTVQAGQ